MSTTSFTNPVAFDPKSLQGQKVENLQI